MPDNTELAIKDAEARSAITAIEQAIAGGTHFIGISTTAIADGDDLKVLTVTGKGDIAIADQKDGDIFFYQKDGVNLEFIVANGKYYEFGSTGTLKALAFKDTASASYTPAGTITTTYTPEGSVAVNPITPAGTTKFNYQPEGTVVGSTTAAGTAKFNYQPEGTVSAPTISVTPSTTTLDYLSSATYATTTETLSFAVQTGVTVATGIASAASSAPTFTGTKVTDGAQVSFTGTEASITASFTGTKVTDGAQVSFTGTLVTPTASFAGTAAATNIASFSGTTATITVS